MKKSRLIPFLMLFILTIGVGTISFSQSDNDESVQIDTEITNSKTDKTQPEQSSDESKSSEDSSEKSYQFKGEFNSWLGIGLNNSNKTEFNYNRLQLELTEVYKEITFFIKGSGRYNTLYNNTGSQDPYRRGENLRFDINEAYVNYELAPDSLLKQINFTIGQQIVNWGKADEVRPTDIISPQDMTLMVLEDRIKRKLGRFAVKTNFNFGESFRFEAIWLPVQRSTEATMDSNSIFTPYSIKNWLNSGKTISSFDMPANKLSNTDIALKAYLQILNTDMSFSFYNGYNPMPYFEYQNSTTLKPFLSRVTMWGFDFERTIGAGIVIRGEAAYFTQGQLFNYSQDNFSLINEHGSSGIVEKKYLDATMGFDKNNFLASNLYLNLQYSINHVFDYQEGLLTPYMTEIKKTNHTGIGLISYEFFNLRYKIELAGNYNFTQKDYLIKPSFHIKIGPETKIILGAYFFGGNHNTYMGQFNDKNFTYLKLEHLF